MGAWRYTTDLVTCLRHWRWYANVGPAEVVRAGLPACVKAGALALPLLAGPAAAPLPGALPAVPGKYWPGEALGGSVAPYGAAGGYDQFAGGGLLPFGPGFGAGGFETTPGFGPADIGWGVFPGLSAGSLTQPASLTVDARPGVTTYTAWANLAPQQRTEVRPALPGGQQGSNGGAGTLPPLLSSSADTSQPVPSPSGLLCLLPAFLVLAVLRRKVWR